jgi:hypothetical protein
MATVSLATYPSLVISVLMRNAAREAVKYNIRAEGLKVRTFPAKDMRKHSLATIATSSLLEPFELLSEVRSCSGCWTRSSGNGRSGLHRTQNL